MNTLIGQHQFDFLLWEINAFWAKGETILANGHAYLDQEAGKEVVLEFLQLVHLVAQLDSAINQLYVSPDVDDPDTASRDLQVELAAKRRALSRLQPVAEAIVQEQVAAVLVDEGFGILGQAWPPVLMRMTSLPLLMVVSPRNHIESKYQVSLKPGFLLPEQEELETAVFNTLDLSALVVPLGGLGTYPSMIIETSNLSLLIEVTAHEWTHHWLTLQPLGLRYGAEPQVRVINETVASIVDTEIRDMVLERFYPEFVLVPSSANSLPAEIDPDAEPPFNFQAEMAITRIETEALLAEGKIEEAERYMEERRTVFVANGYNIRKINQAYFAFYGAYAAEPGATGADPIGPMLRQIRLQSPSLRVFLERVAPITSFADLEAVFRGVNDGDD